MRVAVVGGGMTGLAAAHALVTASSSTGRTAGEVVLLEADARLGGKVLTVRRDGFLLEAGPDAFLTTKPHALHLTRALGLEAELIGPGEPRTVAVFWRGRLQPLPEGLALIAPTRVGPLLRSTLFGLLEKARMGCDLLLPARRDDGDESLAVFVRRRLGQAAVDRLASPLLGGIYAGDVERLSLRATFPHLAEVERRYGSLIRGLVASRPARPGASAGPGLPVFMTLRAGMGRLVERLVEVLEAAGVAVRAGTAVETIERRPGGYMLHLADGGRVDADGVILACPAYAAARLLARLAPEAARLLDQIRYASTATVSLAFPAMTTTGVVPGGHGFVVARGEGVRITACTCLSAKWPGRAPPGTLLLRAYVGSALDPDVLTMTDDEIVAEVRRDLARTMGLTAGPLFSVVTRWPQAMPQYEVGHLERLAEVDRRLAAVPGLTLAGAGYRGLGLPDCIRQGQEAAHRLFASLG
ncbi:MAG: protoporphyrinogen oxidase [Armatimonadota bacterium]|nr:protoporphyrinogen oxidase [Armatimonadota bacterium]MDR7458410.1 protoporphyrinogen oxidase [Armatimonadota bacterium]MDR7478788.1 protoporphyrinogen oxidase [Armatimonadota bacterium]MDR7488246.1 protoporphyrinogen oxidase [Armatimonadota bacterium]MDR7490605.1 protoporphyrinogen oxidase [Armatimonadota bacterium]